MNMQCETCKSELPVGALFCGECGNSVRSSSAPAQSAPPVPKERPVEVSAYESQTPDFSKPVTADSAETNIVPQLSADELGELFVVDETPVAPARVFATEVELESVATFTVTLATGESVDMSRSALLGRMPQAQSGEEFEHLIVVTDPGRSVSKTHLELGVSDGQLWALDRNSGNGSIIREPGVVPRRAQAGTKYPVVRGTRIDIGDQHITIS